MSFGSRLKARREQLGITQIQLAQKLGITKGAVGNYEAEISSPKADILYRVFDVLQEVVGSIPIVSTKKNTGKTVKKRFSGVFCDLKKCRKT